jgi:RHS repeat-associated protein
MYRGERFDAGLSMYDLRARLYTPGNGRFLTQDAFPGFGMDPRSLHKYAFTHADPINLSDPSGYSPLIGTLQTVNLVGNLYTVASIGFQLYTGNYAGAAKDIAEEIVYSKLGGAFGKRVVNYTKEQVGLFYRAFEKTLRGKPKLGLDPNPNALSHNMEVFGVPKPTGTQAHHIVGGVTDIGKNLQRRLREKFVIDLNSPMNGVFLPGCGNSNAIGMVHCGKHTRAYEEAVAERLASATDKASAINILSDIRHELLSGTFTKLNVRAQ